MNQAPASCVPVPKMSKARKIVEEAKETKNPELDLADKALTSFLELPGLFNMINITRLTLSHNRIKEVPPGLANLTNLEILNLCNNIIEELPTSLSSMPKLRILNLAINRLSKLPRGFGAFPILEVLDLTYNNLQEDSFLGNFFMMGLAPLASISSLGSFNSQSSSQTSKSFNTTNNNPSDNQCTCADDSVGSDSVFMDDMELEDDAEFGTDSELEYDGFDDDYSFCESMPRPVSGSELRTLKFASFDSYDTSINQDSVVDLMEEVNKEQEEQSSEKPVHVFSRQHSNDLKRHPSLHEGTKVRRKLVKTNSEPRSGRILKQLPPWTEKGRSGYVPKRHLSSPSPKRKSVVEVSKELNQAGLSGKETNSESLSMPQENETGKDLKFLFPLASSSSSDSATLTPSPQKSDETSTSSPKQGFSKDMPFKSSHQLSLPNTQEKRSRLQKQKNFIEDLKPTNDKTDVQRLTGTEESTNFPSSQGLLKPPNIAFKGSCERLANPNLCEEIENVPDIHIPVPSYKVQRSE